MKSKSRDMQAPLRAVWAVNPFEKGQKLPRASLKALQRFAGRGSAEVIPVYLREAALFETLQGPSAREIASQRNFGQKKVDQWTKHFAIDCWPFRILSKPHTSLKDAASHLVRFSKRVRADVIVLSTHSRHGPEKWILGSFAETLSTLSDIPLLVANPKSQILDQNRAILFPTDFSPASRAGFDRLLEIARKRNWSVTIFHRVGMPVYPVDEFSLIGWDMYNQAHRSEIKLAEDRVREMRDYATKSGVTADAVVDEARPGSVADAVLAYLKEKKRYLWVAAVAHNSAVSRVFMGSTTGELIRRSPIPVWVVHPDVTKTDISREARDREPVVKNPKKGDGRISEQVERH